MHHDLKKASLFGISNAFFFSISAFFVKLAAPDVQINMMILFRFGIGLAYILLLLGIKKLHGKKVTVKTKHFFWHGIRSVFALLAMSCFYYSLRFIPLVDSNLLLMTNALFVPIIGWIAFGHKSTFKHWSTVLIGFIGIIFVLKPGHEFFNPVSAIALLGGVFSSVSFLFVRQVAKKDPGEICLFYYFSLAFVITLIFSIFDWQTPSKHSLVYLILIGVLGTLYQSLFIKAASYAPAKIISALTYFSVFFSVIFGIFFFHEIPDVMTWIGMALICSGSIATLKYAKKPI